MFTDSQRQQQLQTTGLFVTFVTTTTTETIKIVDASATRKNIVPY